MIALCNAFVNGTRNPEIPKGLSREMYSDDNVPPILAQQFRHKERALIYTYIAYISSRKLCS